MKEVIGFFVRCERSEIESKSVNKHDVKCIEFLNFQALSITPAHILYQSGVIYLLV